jgi:hypothetical protein
MSWRIADELLSRSGQETWGGAFCCSGMRQEMPFTKENRPWMTEEHIRDLNDQYVACMAQIDPEYREGLKEWAASKVELGYCRGNPHVIEHVAYWGLVQQKKAPP